MDTSVIEINSALVKKQGLSETQICAIKDKHRELNQLIDILNKLEFNDENKDRILQLTKSIEVYEFTLQKLWGFDIDSKYHTHWLRNKHCVCPRMDNLDIMYYGRGKIVRDDCPIHNRDNFPELWGHKWTS